MVYWKRIWCWRLDHTLAFFFGESASPTARSSSIKDSIELGMSYFSSGKAPALRWEFSPIKAITRIAEHEVERFVPEIERDTRDNYLKPKIGWRRTSRTSYVPPSVIRLFEGNWMMGTPLRYTFFGLYFSVTNPWRRVFLPKWKNL